MLRVLLYVVLVSLLLRALTRLWAGIVAGITDGSATEGRVPQTGVQMMRDPVCGTFVVPARAVVLSTGRDRIYFCSARCRDAYDVRTARTA